MTWLKTENAYFFKSPQDCWSSQMASPKFWLTAKGIKGIPFLSYMAPSTFEPPEWDS